MVVTAHMDKARCHEVEDTSIPHAGVGDPLISQERNGPGCQICAIMHLKHVGSDMSFVLVAVSGIVSGRYWIQNVACAFVRVTNQ